jgi:two-component system, LytTR family, sensor kinase
MYAILGGSLYCVAFMGLDYYVLHLIMPFMGVTPFDLAIKCFLTTATAIIYIESARWAKEREKARIDNLNLQSENIEAKFQLLKEQVNPEFLFQSLKTLQTMVKKEDPNTEGYVLKLANVYRQTLNKDRNIVSLKEELGLLQNYMYLMRYGRESAISFDINVSEASLKAHLPVFALQLLGDNCIKHNVFSETQPLHIRLYQKDENTITLTNNYQRQEIPKSFGIEIDRLTMRYEMEGIENGVSIEHEPTTYSTTLKLF